MSDRRRARIVRQRAENIRRIRERREYIESVARAAVYVGAAILLVGYALEDV